MAQLVKKIKFEATIELITGLHIGGNKDSVEIGGIDLPVIKLATKGNQPYIPGSSLKGKMRCLLEQRYGIKEHGDKGGEKEGGRICSLFGYARNNEAQPSRLIVRDAMLTPEAKIMLENCDNLDMPFTENKFENSISRITGKAEKGIRQIERVPAGAEFKVEFIINVWDEGGCEELLIDTFKEGISMLKNDYIGGSGSRGYGQITFKNWKASQYGNVFDKGTDKNETDWLTERPYELKI